MGVLYGKMNQFPNIIQLKSGLLQIVDELQPAVVLFSENADLSFGTLDKGEEAFFIVIAQR